MVPNPYGLYDDDVRTRTLWAFREALVVGGILLFWVAVAVALTIVLLVLSAPFALFRFGAPGLPVAELVWTIVGPLTVLTASLYVFVRAGTVIVDHYRNGEGLQFEPAPAVTRSDGGSGDGDEFDEEPDEFDEEPDEFDEADASTGTSDESDARGDGTDG